MASDILVVDDEEDIRELVAGILSDEGHETRTAFDSDSALAAIADRVPRLILLDIWLQGSRMDGLALLDEIKTIHPNVPVVMISGHGTIETAVSALRRGAYDFIEKPFASETLADAAKRACEKRRLVLENRSLKARLASSSGIEQVIVGRTPQVARLRSQITAYAATDADVLIMGETGTGKEIVARSLHDFGPRATGRFVPINCGALPEAVIESELFGHEQGAFTGAQKARVGKLEYASGGTVFLDEIESMPMALQIKLLRVLQDRRIARLGANEERDIDVRVIAATKEDLKAASQRGTFREDLYYRLNVLTLSIPPLRDRRDDIPLLFQHFVDVSAGRFKSAAPSIDAGVVTALLAHRWPGNVRELQNSALRYALGLGLEIDGVAVAAALSAAPDGHAPGSALADQLSRHERQIISDTLARTGHSLKATYEALGVSRKTLYDKMRRYGLGKPPADEDEG